MWPSIISIANNFSLHLTVHEVPSSFSFPFKESHPSTGKNKTTDPISFFFSFDQSQSVCLSRLRSRQQRTQSVPSLMTSSRSSRSPTFDSLFFPSSKQKLTSNSLINCSLWCQRWSASMPSNCSSQSSTRSMCVLHLWSGVSSPFHNRPSLVSLPRADTRTPASSRTSLSSCKPFVFLLC